MRDRKRGQVDLSACVERVIQVPILDLQRDVDLAVVIPCEIVVSLSKGLHERPYAGTVEWREEDGLLDGVRGFFLAVGDGDAREEQLVYLFWIPPRIPFPAIESARRIAGKRRNVPNKRLIPYHRPISPILVLCL